MATPDITWLAPNGRNLPWDGRTVEASRGVGQGAADAALRTARGQPGCRRAGGAATQAARRVGGRMARRLRLSNELRGKNALHRPVPLAGAVRRPPATQAHPARPSGAR